MPGISVGKRSNPAEVPKKGQREVLSEDCSDVGANERSIGRRKNARLHQLPRFSRGRRMTGQHDCAFGVTANFGE